MEGRRYIDLVQSYGAIIAGHAHPAIVEAVADAAAGGTSYGAPTPGEVCLAETIVDAVPAIEQVRFVSSGTEATMSAIRLARGFTGRDRIVKFAGNYHGHSDGLLADAGSSVAQLDADPVGADGGVPGSAGVPPGAVATTTIVPYNVVPNLDDTVAAVIVEPIAANMGLVPPGDGFLEGLAAECRRVGALLIFDEVITGFRIARGGATERFGVTPDLVTLGKVIGGGLPVGAFGGRAEIMARLAPDGPVYQAGTLSGNPLAMAAGLAALELLDAPAYDRLSHAAQRLSAGLGDAFKAADAPMIASTAGNLVGIFAGSTPPHDFTAAKQTDEAAYARFFHAHARWRRGARPRGVRGGLLRARARRRGDRRGHRGGALGGPQGGRAVSGDPGAHGRGRRGRALRRDRRPRVQADLSRPVGDPPRGSAGDSGDRRVLVEMDRRGHAQPLPRGGLGFR